MVIAAAAVVEVGDTTTAEAKYFVWTMVGDDRTGTAAKGSTDERRGPFHLSTSCFTVVTIKARIAVNGP